MSQLIKALEERIDVLKSGIESQQQELVAYALVLSIEAKKQDSGEPTAAIIIKLTQQPAAEIAFSGNKTSLVIEIVRSFGSKGASAKDVESSFSERSILTAQNFVYSTLSALLARKRLVRRDGRYFGVDTSVPVSRPSSRSGPTAKKQMPHKKRRISPEGLKRIREAVKRRWAGKRAGARKVA